MRKSVPPLNMRKFPDPPRRSSRKSHGRLTGLGVREYWHFLFELNETLPRKKKMNEEGILFQLEQEFPDRPQATRRIHSGEIRLGFYRYLYNSGRLCPKKGKPHLRSYRYNEDGLRINGKSGTVLPDNMQQKRRGKK